MSADGDFPCRIHFPDETPALFASCIVHNHYGHILQYSVFIYHVVQQGVAKAGEEEHHYHAAVAEYGFELLSEKPSEIIPKCLEISHFNPSCNYGIRKHSSALEAEAVERGRTRDNEALPSTIQRIQRRI